MYNQIHEEIHFGSSNLMITEDLMKKVVSINQFIYTYHISIDNESIMNLQITYQNMHMKMKIFPLQK